MTVSEFLDIVRFRIDDKLKVAYSDGDLMQFMNDAITFLNTELIAIKDPIMVKEMSITGSKLVPSDFVRFAGKHAVYIADNTIKLINDGDSIDSCLYFAYKPRVASLTDVVPFGDIELPILVQLTCIYALNKNEYSTEQDERLCDKLREVVRIAKGGN